MTWNSQAPSTTERRPSKEVSGRRWEHLQHIYPMTREQQIAQVEEARAARKAEQARRADS